MDVVYIVLDTLRQDALSVYNPDITFTPHVETFAGDGLVFDDAVAQAPWSFPSHASMFTGKYPWEHGATQEHLLLDVSSPVLAERFRAAGYRTAAFHRNGWLTPHLGMMHGFDHVHQNLPVVANRLFHQMTASLWRGLCHRRWRAVQKQLVLTISSTHLWREQRKETDNRDLIDAATAFLDRRLRREDAFVFLNLMGAHYPYTPADTYAEKHLPTPCPNIRSRPWEYGGPVFEEEQDLIRGHYHAEVDYLDDQLARLFSFLSESGRLEDTLVVLVGDHGEHLGENGMMGHHFSVADELISVPLIIHHPDMAGQRIAEQVELRELYDILPGYAGIAETPDIGVEYAHGGYATPCIYRERLPPEKKQQFDHSIRFTRGHGEKEIYQDSDVAQTTPGDAPLPR